MRIFCLMNLPYWDVATKNRICLYIGIFLFFNYMILSNNYGSVRSANNSASASSFIDGYYRYYRLDIRRHLDELEPITLRGANVVAGVNLDLYTGIQSAQNDLFDMVSFLSKTTILIEFQIPSNVVDGDLDRFITYQALNYSFILSRLMPEAQLRNLRVRAFRRGGVGEYVEYNYWFDLHALQSLEGVSYRRAYRKIGKSIKQVVDSEKPLVLGKPAMLVSSSEDDH